MIEGDAPVTNPNRNLNRLVGLIAIFALSSLLSGCVVAAGDKAVDALQQTAEAAIKALPLTK